MVLLWVGVATSSWDGEAFSLDVEVGPSLLKFGLAPPSHSGGRPFLLAMGVGPSFSRLGLYLSFLWWWLARFFFGCSLLLELGLALWVCRGVGGLAFPSWDWVWPVLLIVGVGLSFSLPGGNSPFHLAVSVRHSFWEWGVGLSWVWDEGWPFLLGVRVGPAFSLLGLAHPSCGWVWPFPFQIMLVGYIGFHQIDNKFMKVNSSS